jgi:chromosome segregation ATPase
MILFLLEELPVTDPTWYLVGGFALSVATNIAQGVNSWWARRDNKQSTAHNQLTQIVEKMQKEIERETNRGDGLDADCSELQEKLDCLLDKIRKARYDLSELIYIIRDVRRAVTEKHPEYSELSSALLSAEQSLAGISDGLREIHSST